MAKDMKSLTESRGIRNVVKSQFGLSLGGTNEIPRSIMRADWSDSAIDLSTSYQDGKEASKYMNTPFSLSGVGARHGQLSRFPQNIAKWIVNFYTPARLTGRQASYFDNGLPTILDPTMGHNSRMQAVFRTGRNYVGHDISAGFMEMNREVRDVLLAENNMFNVGAKIELHEGDSRYMNYPPVFDLCMTSPPYWDLEDYGSQEGQLGKLKGGYAGFLRGLEQVIECCYNALKPGAFIVWEFQDFTKNGKFYAYPFHASCIFERFFSLQQIIIVDYMQGFLRAFAQDIVANKLVSKEHSYLIVAQKKIGKKVRQEVRKELLETVSSKKKKGEIAHQYALEWSVTQGTVGTE